MQKRPKAAKKKSDNLSTLTRSLSARISPLAITQKFTPGSFDLENVIRKRGLDNPLCIGAKKFSFLVKTKSAIGLPQGKIAKIGSKHQTENASKRREAMVEKDNSEDGKIYLNELKMKIKEIQMENNLFRVEIREKEVGNKKVWRAAEHFKGKLKAKLNLLN